MIKYLKQLGLAASTAFKVAVIVVVAASFLNALRKTEVI